MTHSDPLLLAERLEKAINGARFRHAYTCEELNALIEAAQPAAQALRQFAWRPISEAKRDGTQYLAIAVADRVYRGVAQWAEKNPAFPNSIAGWFWPYAIRPTHYCEIPAPPQAEPKD